MRAIEGPQRARLRVDGVVADNFSSNNYLGLADHPRLTEQAAKASQENGFGAGASRLIVGNLAPHRALEARVAEWKGTEAALLFNSGYQANVGMVSALVGPEDAVFSDELNHASLIDGCRLSRAQVFVYRHSDCAELDQQLAAATAFRRRLIVTDSVFSMDGDQAPLAALAALARRHSALLAVDEAHAVGVLGEGGRGLGADAGADLQMGTLGKALGGFGAYVAGSRPLIELLANRARSFVFTTALPVPVVAFAHAALDWLASEEGQARRRRLAQVIERFHHGLSSLGLTPPLPSHIVPVRVRGGEPRRAMEASEALLARGIFAQGIRPPTVPSGTARVRFALMATHSDAQLERALAALAALRPLFA
ncbi:MAG: 8-amino-7-oxononanoate synthase [Polyangia bacterium]